MRCRDCKRIEEDDWNPNIFWCELGYRLDTMHLDEDDDEIKECEEYYDGSVKKIPREWYPGGKVVRR